MRNAMNDTITDKEKNRIHVVFKDHEKPKRPSQQSPIPTPVQLANTSHKPLEAIQKKLDRMVGMEAVKATVKEIYAWIHVNKLREAHNLKVQQQSLHMTFKGNPGTGKTTVARLLGELFNEMAVLSKGHLIEVERADLVGEYIGQTAQKTRELVKKAMGGILFIDEAYALGRGGEKDFGKEAIDTLVKQMEDKKDEFILILAGYSDEMDRFMRLNPGLPSRFPIQIDFPNYDENELLTIGDQMIDERDYRLTNEAKHKFVRHLREKRLNDEHGFSNGRYVRNTVEKTIRRQSVRLLREGVTDRDALMTLRATDLHLEVENDRERE